jgi:lipopolysaccharide export system protein LptA
VQILRGTPYLAFVFLILSSLNPAFSADDKKLAQIGADQTTLKRKEHLVLLRGNAYIFRDNEVIRADSIDYNNETQLVHAKGRVTYQYSSYTIRANEIEIDLVSHVGTVWNGNVSNGRFSLRGSKLLQEGTEHFKVQDYNYSTCLDCPNSWELTGKDADFTIGGYAFIHDFVFKIKDTSLLWLPFLVVPVKSERESGILFPRFGVNQVYGAYAVQPVFLAINSWSDMTVGGGYYASRGARFEWEGRYALTSRSQGTLNFFWTRDNSVTGLGSRFSLKTAMTQELPFGFEGKLKINEVSDSGYPITYSEDITGRLEPVLSSDLFFSRNDPNVSTVISLRRFRNLLQFDSNGKYVEGLDGRTVQEFPRVVVNSNDRFIFGQSFAAGIEARFNRFTRASGPFDSFTAGGVTTETIREANRLTVIPNLYTTLNPKPWLSLTPSVQYRSFFYNFSGVYQNLARGYLLGQAELSMQLERIFPSESKGVSYKHLIRPMLTYSVIPTVQASASHPFVEQVQNQARPGQYFDNWDIVPQKATQNLNSYFTPLGNSLTYGVVSQVFKRSQDSDGSSKTARRFEAGFNQTIDLLEAQRFIQSGGRDDRIILSPFFSHLTYGDDSFAGNLEYTYYAFLDRYQDAQLLSFPSPHRLSSSFSWIWVRQVKDGLMKFDRSITAGYTFSKLTSRVSSLQTSANLSLNDYIMPKVALSYNLVPGFVALLDSSLGVLFQSPSRCWQLELGLNRSIDRGTGFLFNFALNFSGESFGTLDDSLKK